MVLVGRMAAKGAVRAVECLGRKQKRRLIVRSAPGRVFWWWGWGKTLSRRQSSPPCRARLQRAGGGAGVQAPGDDLRGPCQGRSL
jgi:hypothetical protein